jgi:hypothetical protein
MGWPSITRDKNQGWLFPSLQVRATSPATHRLKAAAVPVHGRVDTTMSNWSMKMSMKSLAAAMAVAVSIAGLAAPAAQAKGGKHFHHRHFFIKPYVYEPVCAKWVYSVRYGSYVCRRWY